MEFIETNHRNLPKYRAGERNYYNFVMRCGGAEEEKGMSCMWRESWNGRMRVNGLWC